MKKPLEFCVNHPDRPTQRPSWVLCDECLKALNAKFDRLIANLDLIEQQDKVSHSDS
jgi:hypothetical protein